MTFVQAAAESLPFEDSSFDTVVSTLVLCSVDETGCSRHDSPVRVALDPQLVGADGNAVNLRGLYPISDSQHGIAERPLGSGMYEYV